MGEPLFGRRVTAVIDGVRVDERFRIAFTVRHTKKATPNTLELEVYNLSEHTRGQIKTKGALVSLSAGYGDGAGLIFQGNIRTVDHVRDGADWVTRVRSGDGEAAFQFAHVSKTFGPGSSLAAVVKEVARIMGLGMGNIDAMLAKLPNQFVHGYTAHGKAVQEMERLLRSVGMTWSIQDGSLQVLSAGAPVSHVVAVVLSPETGLLGSPDHSAALKHKGPPVAVARALLNPRLRVGARVLMQAAAVKGDFRVEADEHRGDTEGPDFFSRVELLPVVT